MSKLFFDHLLDYKKLDKEIKKVAKTPEEREEIWLIIDEIVHHKALGCILDRLHHDNHEEFLDMFHKSPHDTDLLFNYLRDKVDPEIESMLRADLDNLATELIHHTKNTP